VPRGEAAQQEIKNKECVGAVINLGYIPALYISFVFLGGALLCCRYASSGNGEVAQETLLLIALRPVPST